MSDTRRHFSFRLLPGEFTVLRLAADAPVPAWALAGAFFSVTRTDDELSIVCEQSRVPSGPKASPGWSCLKLEGPFAFDETGIVAGISARLAEAGVGIFVLSTFDTDYIMVQTSQLSQSLRALEAAGHTIRPLHEPS